MTNSIGKNKNPLISVIITTFNRRDFILEAVESVLSQTYKNIEIIIVDDGSTDNTERLIYDIYGDNEKVSFFYKENGKRASAFNLGLDKSGGDYIAILDSDNRYLPHRIESGLRALQENPGYDISYADIVTINEEGKEIHRSNMSRYSGNISKYLVYDNCVSINTALVPRYCFDVLGPMDVSYKRSDDYELWLRLSTKYRFLYIKDFWSEYRVMENQLSSNTIGRLDVNLRLIHEFKDNYAGSVSKKDIYKGLCRIHSLKSLYYSGLNKKGSATKEFLKAFRYNPFSRLTIKSFVFIFRVQ